jgi:chromosomal replication initiation ATPase DnaA
MNKQQIIETVCNICGVTPADIFSHSKQQKITDAKLIIAYILVEKGISHSCLSAGKDVGLKSNSMCTQFKKIPLWIKTSPAFKQKFEASIVAIK